MKINKTSHPIRFHYPGEISKFISRDRQGRGDKSIWFWEKFDLKIKSTRENRMDLANKNEENGDRRNTYK